MTRAKLESLVQEYIDRSIALTKETVTAAAPKGAGFQLADINEIIMVGGQTRMPAIVEAVKKLFGKDPHQGINPDEVVAIGAAVQAGILQGDVKDILLLDVTPLTLVDRNIRRGCDADDPKKHDGADGEDADVLNRRG